MPDIRWLCEAYWSIALATADLFGCGDLADVPRFPSSFEYLYIVLCNSNQPGLATSLQWYIMIYYILFTLPVVEIKSGQSAKKYIPYPQSIARVTLSGFKSPQHKHMQRYAEIESSQLELTQDPGLWPWMSLIFRRQRRAKKSCLGP